MSSTTTVSGATVPNNFTDSTAAFANFFNSQTSVTIYSTDTMTTVSGAAVLSDPNTAVTLMGATAVADTSTGSNSITTTSDTAVFAAADDTVTASTGSTTLFGASSGQTNFTLGGSGSSIVGGTGAVVGTVSGANSTLIGGSASSMFTVTGSNSLAVAGSSGMTGIDLSKSTGAQTIATNPNGGNGQLVATLGSGADSVIGGGGAATITAGAGSDVFGFVNGHAGGTEIIVGFTSSDTMAFGGYGANPISSEGVINGSDTIVLTDGTTITLAGVDHTVFKS